MAQVPDSRVEHRWAHSAPSAGVSDVYTKARERFYRKNFKLSALMGGGDLSEVGGAEPPLMAERPGEEQRNLWLASPLPHGFPAAGSYIDGDPSARIYKFLDVANMERATVSCVDPQKGRIDGPWTFRRDVQRRMRRSV